MWKTHSGESWMQVMLTGTKSSETCCHLTVPAPLALTWNTSAHSLKPSRCKALSEQQLVLERKNIYTSTLSLKPFTCMMHTPCGTVGLTKDYTSAHYFVLSSTKVRRAHFKDVNRNYSLISNVIKTIILCARNVATTG